MRGSDDEVFYFFKRIIKKEKVSFPVLGELTKTRA